MALVYSTAEYCAPVWKNSTHVSMVDVQLNHSMRLISGCLMPTPAYWLPALSHIAPPHIRREACLNREMVKILGNPTLPINEDLEPLKKTRLKSRDPPAKSFHTYNPSWKAGDAWRSEWSENPPSRKLFVPSTTQRPAGFCEPRSVWCRLNRLRTGVGNCAYLWHKWGWSESAACECGHPQQTIDHIVFECPITKYAGPADDFTNLTSSATAYLNNCSF
ncbi:hypothetical protein JYU34_000975 [Plutella xylostella]|uniref:Uncharacterized protein n=1 Tax=Plutella xylostella TaxID=51655 RepID=A0ABQ7R5S3_PLUXY|nr:hypothetical protein JYU34_000975 [Plutella xylostella]